MALLLAVLVTAATYLLQSTLNYPAILLDHASLAETLAAQGRGAGALGFLGLLLSGVVVGALSLGLASYARAASHRASQIGLLAGGATALGALLGLALLAVGWSPAVAALTFALAEVAASLLLALWTLALAARRDGHGLYPWLGRVGAVGLLLVVARSLVWGLNALLPVTSGFFATAGALNVFALLGQSLWLFWLLLVGLRLLIGGGAPTVVAPSAGRTQGEGEARVGRRRLLAFSAGVGATALGVAFVGVRTGLMAAALPTFTDAGDADDVPTEPSLIGTLYYFIAMIYLKFIRPVRTISDQLAVAATSSATPLPPGVTRERVNAGGVPADRLRTPGARAGRYLFYIHGGGFAQAASDDTRAFAARIAQGIGATALMPDYRLTPAHPFPAGLDDCLTAYRWLLGQGVEPNHIGFAGDSAGANLVLTVALAARDAGLPLPAALTAFSPPTDLTMSGVTYRTKALVDPILGAGLPADAFRLYTDNGAISARNPLVSPLFANLRGLPPTLLQVGTQEVLLSDSTRMADRLRAAGVVTQLEIWPGMFHAFTGGTFPDAQQATNHVIQFIKRHLRG